MVDTPTATTATTAPAATSRGSRAATPRIAAVSAFFGSTLEYYDFGVFGVASALFFGPVFFPAVDPAAGTLLALATFGAAYVTRPLGAVIWGHLGDRVGRTRVLLLTLLLMGAATFLVGCLPDYGTIGVAAPILLLVLRLLQGLSAGGESTGSSSVALEHAPDGRRAFYSSFASSGLSAGYVLSNAVSLAATLMPRDAALAWGWRIPFLVSALVFVVTYVIRRRLAEPESFHRMKRQAAVVKLPVAEVFRHSPLSMLRVFLASLYICIQTLVFVYSLSFASSVVHLDRSRMVQVIIVAVLATMVTTPLFGRLSDRWGRRPVFVIGSVGTAVFLVLFFAAIVSRDWVLIVVSAVVLMGVFQGMMHGGAYAYFLELFPARTRFTGMGISMMLGLIASGFAPALAEALVGHDEGHWLRAAVVFAVVALVSGLAVLTGPETSRVPTAELDR